MHLSKPWRGSWKVVVHDHEVKPRHTRLPCCDFALVGDTATGRLTEGIHRTELGHVELKGKDALVTAPLTLSRRPSR